MTIQSLCCPYCNALATVPANAPEGQRILCHRCGESFAYRGPFARDAAITAEPGVHLPPGTSSSAPSAVRDLIETGPRWSNRKVRGVVLGVMGVMAIVGLIFALSTVAYRRSRDPRPPRTLAVEVELSTPPIELTALGYLPPETSIVAAVHVAEARRSAAGKELLARVRFGANGISLADLDKWTGIPTDDIDHAVLGLKVDNRLVPPLVLVVQTRQPYDAEKVRATLKSNRSAEVGKKTVHFFTAGTQGKMTFEAVLWCAGPRTLVVSLIRGDMDSVPDRPFADGKQLPSALAALLKDRMNGSQVWLAGHVEKWEAMGLLLTMLLPKDSIENLKRMRTFGYWFQVDQQGLQVHGAVQGADEAATLALAKEWDKKDLVDGQTFLKELGPMVQELNASWSREVKDGWFTFRARASAESVGRAP